MKTLALIALSIIPVVNTILLIAMLYWWVFSGEVLPIIEGRPVEDVVLLLLGSAGASAIGFSAVATEWDT